MSNVKISKIRLQQILKEEINHALSSKRNTVVLIDMSRASIEARLLSEKTNGIRYDYGLLVEKVDLGDRLAGFWRGAKEKAADVLSAAEEALTNMISYTPSGTAKSMNSGVEVTEKIKNAWEWLSPILPDGAVMTSGLRTQAKQDSIIRDYAGRNNIPVTSLGSALAALKEKGYVIARYVSSRLGFGHGGGGAMDISGAPLDQIEAAVIAAHNDPDMKVQFRLPGTGRSSSIKERRNNAFHTEIASAEPADPTAIQAAVAKYTGAGSTGSETV